MHNSWQRLYEATKLLVGKDEIAERMENAIKHLSILNDNDFLAAEGHGKSDIKEFMDFRRKDKAEIKATPTEDLERHAKTIVGLLFDALNHES